MWWKIFLVIVFLIIGNSSLVDAQLKVSDDYLLLNAKADDPIFTTYAATMERSRFFADKAYFLNYFTPDRPITYQSQYAGDWMVIWKVNNIVIDEIEEFVEKPLVVASFPDMVILQYEPFKGLRVQEVFFVYSSGAALVDLSIKNTGSRELEFNLYPLVHLPDDS